MADPFGTSSPGPSLMATRTLAGGANADSEGGATVKPPPPMPDPLGPEVLAAKRAAMAAAGVGGRRSTILTTAATRQPYTSTSLGAA